MSGNEMIRDQIAARATPPVRDAGEPVDDDGFLAQAAPILLSGLRARSVREAVTDATDADGYVRFVGGQVVSQGTLLNKLCALPAAPAPVRVTEAMVEAGLNAMRSCLLDSRHPHHDSDRKLMRDALTAALAASRAPFTAPTPR